MARTIYHDFLDAAREDLDLSYGEARDFYHELRSDGLSPDEVYDTLFGDITYEEEVEVPEWVPPGQEQTYGSFLVEYGEEPPEDWDGFFYDLDDRFLDDEWIDLGEEVEVTATIKYN